MSANEPAVHEHASCEVLVTNACNMSCGYCIARELPGPLMTRDTGRKAIDMFVYLAEGAKTVEFVFTGGEPLIEITTLEYLTGYAERRVREAGMQPHFVLKANGTILNRDIIEFMRAHNMKVVVSLDGTADAHDRHRKARDGQGTHDVVSKNLGTLLDNRIPCVASITVHPDSAETVLENVHFLHALGVDQIDVGPAYGTVSWSDANTLAFVRSLMEIADYMREANVESRQIEIGPLFRESEHVGGILSDQWGCRAASSNLAFLPNGKITGCSALAMLISRFPDLVLGDVFNGLDQLAVDRMLRSAQADKERRQACQECEVASDCTGGCLAINYSTTGSPLAPPPIYCQTIAAIPEGWRRAWGALAEVPEIKPSDTAA
jgi:uncharacterized protein